MSSFLFILLAFLTVSQALAAENDTTVLTKRAYLTLGDIFGYPETTLFTSDLDKREKHRGISVRLKNSNGIWLVPVHLGNDSPISSHFIMDTAGGVCSWVYSHVNLGSSGQVSNEVYDCPSLLSNSPHISGHRHSTKIEIGGMPWQGQVLASSRTPDNEIAAGTLGLALSDDRVPKEMQFLSRFLQNFKTPVFALELSDSNPELHIGAVNQVGLEYYKVVKNIHQQQWLLESGHVYVDDQLVASNIETVFDTSITAIHGSTQHVQQIRAKILGAGHSNPVVVCFQWGNGKIWPVSWNNYQTQFLRTYEGTFQSQQDNLPWLIGNDFFRGKYMVFDADPENPYLAIKQTQFQKTCHPAHHGNVSPVHGPSSHSGSDEAPPPYSEH